jgi:hypothetical protein
MSSFQAVVKDFLDEKVLDDDLKGFSEGAATISRYIPKVKLRHAAIVPSRQIRTNK